MRLEIEWRHVPEGRDSCDRCGDTRAALERLVDELADEVEEGVEVAFTQLVVPRERLDESNQVRIGGVPIEQILDARVTTSACEGCACSGGDCGGQGETASCRALEIDGRLHEALDDALLRRALNRYLALARPDACSTTKVDDGASSACC